MRERGKKACVFANNDYESSAPMTIKRLMQVVR
jgi:hypothetical protein